MEKHELCPICHKKVEILNVQFVRCSNNSCMIGHKLLYLPNRGIRVLSPVEKEARKLDFCKIKEILNQKISIFFGDSLLRQIEALEKAVKEDSGRPSPE